MKNKFTSNEYQDTDPVLRTLDLIISVYTETAYNLQQDKKFFRKRN